MQQFMQAVIAASLLSLGSCVRTMQGVPMTPVSKAVDLLIDMQTKITAGGKNATKIQAKKAEACKLEAKDLGFSIETTNSEIETSKAKIAKASAAIVELNDNIEETTATVAHNEASLAKATKIRENESATFKNVEADLLELIDTLERATAILSREMQKDGALVQGSATTSVVQALESLVQASTLSTHDAARLSALIQSSKVTEDADDSDSEVGAPDAAAYASHSDNIIDVLGTLLDQAHAQLADARKDETTSRNNFALLEQSLQKDNKDANARLADAKKELVATTEVKNTTTDDLAPASAALADDQATLKTLTKICEEGQKNFELASASRDDELTAIDKALEALSTVGAAEERQYGASFLQRSQLASASGDAGPRVARLLHDLARKEDAPELAQLASRVTSVMEKGGDDPFAKVKGQVVDLINRLLNKMIEEQASEAKCDEELKTYEARHGEQTSALEELTATINSKSATSSKLKEEVEAIKESLSDLVNAQAEMDRARKEERAEYEQAVKDMQGGLQGVELALKALSEYYAKEEGIRHQASEAAGSGVIAMLEVVQSDFSLDLARIEETESMAQSAYESLSQANALEKAAKEKDVQYKTKEASTLDNDVEYSSTDRAETKEELAATSDYLEAVKKKCGVQAESFEERTQRHEEEIAGLKEALSILNSEVALTQQRTRFARGILRLKPSTE